MIMQLFTEPAHRAKAMGVFGFVMSSGGALGVLLGGVLTDLFSWHWIFLVNLPVGCGVLLAGRRLLPADVPNSGADRLDVAGAVTVTGALVLAVSGVVGAVESGWTSARTLGLLVAAAVLLTGFVWIEARASEPLVPLGMLRSRNLAVANVVGVLWAGAMSAWFFLAPLYLQQVLHYGPLAVGAAFLPACVIMGALSLRASDRLVLRFGVRPTLTVGLLLAGASLMLFVRAPVGGSYLTDVLPSMLLLGVGAGIAFNPVLLAAMGGVEPHRAGLASGLVNTSFMMGGALGLGVLVSIAAGRTSTLLRAGADPVHALNGGFHLAFLCGGTAALVAALLGGLLLREPPATVDHAAGHGDHPATAEHAGLQPSQARI